MNNYVLHIDKNGWVSTDIIKTIERMDIHQLSNNLYSKILCERKTMCQVCESGSFYQEYDEFYFQAENCVEALDVGMGLYKNQEVENLPKMNRYALALFAEGGIDYDAALSLNEHDAYKKYDKFRKKKYHLSFEEPKKLKVWFFDTVGTCVYGQAIVAAKDKEEAIKTLMEYTKRNGQDVRNFCSDPTMSTELKTSLIEPKVIDAWYEEC